MKIPVLAQGDLSNMPRAAVQTSDLQVNSKNTQVSWACGSQSRKQAEGCSGVQHMDTGVWGVLAILGRACPVKLWIMYFKECRNNSTTLKRINVEFAQLNQRQGQSSFWVSPQLSPQKSHTPDKHPGFMLSAISIWIQFLVTAYGFIIRTNFMQLSNYSFFSVFYSCQSDCAIPFLLI